MLTEKTIRAVTCCRCDAEIRNLEPDQEYEQPQAALILGGTAVVEVADKARSMFELCPRCRKAVVDPIRRLLRLPQEKKGKGEEPSE